MGAPHFVRIMRVRDNGDLPLPQYQTEGASGLDLLADVSEEKVLLPGAREAVPTGIAIQLPEGWEAQIRSRSGLALRDGVVCLNSPGTVDADYRGEIKVILANLSSAPFVVRRGARLAQLIFSKVEKIVWEEASSLSDTDRGKGGFGSTGA